MKQVESRGVLLAAAILGLFVLAASSAQAAEFHPFKFSFDGTGTTAGQFADLESVAIDQTTGTVYTFDRSSTVIDKFNASGVPQNFSSTGTSSLNVISACPGFSIYQYGEEEIAVDSSGTANQGNIYVAAYGGGGVCAFNSAGQFLWHMSPEEDAKLGGACAVTTDSLGRLWIGSYGNGAMRYTATGSPPTLVAIAGSGSSCRFALGTEGKIYMADVFGRGVERWTVVGFEKQITSNGYGVTFDLPTEHLFVTANDRVDEYTTEGIHISETGTGPPFDQTGIGTMSNATGAAVRASTGELYVAARGNGMIKVYGPLKAFPDVTTGAASQITRTSSQLSGEVTPVGGNVSNCEIEWGTSTSYGNTTNCAQATPFAAATPVSANLSGLSAGTAYHYRVVAENTNGANYGGDRSFTTSFVDGVTTDGATAITRTEATLHGSLEPNGIGAHYYFEWGTDQGYGDISPALPGADAGSGSGSTPASAAVNGLQFGTTYHYRLVATNVDGTDYGQDQTFRSLDAVIGLETTAATDLSQTGATLTGKLDPDGLATTYYFEWGPTSSYGNFTSAPPGDSAGTTAGIKPLAASIEGLSTYVTYHYRLVAVNDIGTTHGQDRTLTTEPPLLPAISASAVSNLDSDSATLSAEINPGYGQTVYRFQYGRTTEYEFRTPPKGPLVDDSADHSVSIDIAGLLPGSSYHFRVVAINFAGVSHGPDRTFTTHSAPRVESASASSVTQNGAHIDLQIKPGFEATTFHIEYGGGDYGSSTPESGVIGADGNNHAASVDLAGLAPASTYHFRVVASNGVGTTIGVDRAFTTAPEPVTSVPAPVICRNGFVKRHGKCIKKPRKHQKRRHRARG